MVNDNPPNSNPSLRQKLRFLFNQLKKRKPIMIPASSSLAARDGLISCCSAKETRPPPGTLLQPARVRRPSLICGSRSACYMQMEEDQLCCPQYNIITASELPLEELLSVEAYWHSLAEALLGQESSGHDQQRDQQVSDELQLEAEIVPSYSDAGKRATPLIEPFCSTTGDQDGDVEFHGSLDDKQTQDCGIFKLAGSSDTRKIRLNTLLDESPILAQSFMGRMQMTSCSNGCGTDPRSTEADTSLEAWGHIQETAAVTEVQARSYGPGQLHEAGLQLQKAASQPRSPNAPLAGAEASCSTTQTAGPSSLIITEDLATSCDQTNQTPVTSVTLMTLLLEESVGCPDYSALGGSFGALQEAEEEGAAAIDLSIGSPFSHHANIHENIPSLLICCVCMVRHKDAALIPCGHTFCRACSKQLAACPLCNALIAQVLDIF